MPLSPVPAPNWDKWRHMIEIEMWEAVALSLNLEPDKLPVYLGAYELFGDNPFSICPPKFQERLQIANSNCGVSFPFNAMHALKARCLVYFPAFGAWAAGIWPDLPSEFPIAAPKATSKPSAATVEPAPMVDVPTKTAPLSNWKYKVQAEAWEHWLRLRAYGCNPSVHSICEDMARWCTKENIKGGKGQNPRAGTIRNTVLGAGHWTPPSHSVAEATKYLAQIAQTAQTEVAQTKK